jgi:hypothetical protein
VVDFSDIAGGANAGLQSFANTASFGLSPKASALIASKYYGVPYQQALAAVTARNEQLAKDHPYANIAGDIGGLVTGGRALADLGLTGARTMVGRMAQNALVGGTVSAANQAATDGTIDERTGLAGLGGAATGAIVGEGAQVLGSTILNRISPAASNAWRFMGKKLGVDADTLRQRYQSYQATTGARPALAQLLSPVEQQRLRATAFASPDLGSNIRQYAGEVAQNDASVGALTTARDRTMNQVMGAPASTAPGAPAVRDVPVNLDPAFLYDPNFARAVRANPDIRLEVAQNFNHANGSTTVSLNSADRLRTALNDLHANARGGPYRGLRDQLVQHVDSQVPGYANVIQDYADTSKGITGFQHGMSGQGPLQASGDVASALATPSGQAGFRQGQTTLAGQNAVANAVPSRSVIDEGLSPGTSELARGAAHLASGSVPLGLFHMARGMLPHLSVAEQAIVSRGLLSRDPAIVQETLGRLQSSGATQDQLNALSSAAGGKAAAAFGGGPGVAGDNTDQAAPQTPGKPNFYYSEPAAAPAPSGNTTEAPAAPAKPKFYYAQ